MCEHQTKIEVCGNDYPAVISYEWDESVPIIDRVQIHHAISCDYNDSGEFQPHVETIIVDITRLLDRSQLKALADEILYRATEMRIHHRRELHLYPAF